MLEQQVYEAPRVQEKKENYIVISDLESLSASVLYTGDLPPMGPGGMGVLPSRGLDRDSLFDLPMFSGSSDAGSDGSLKPIGSVSNFQTEGVGNISTELNLGKFAPEAKGYSLTERYDASHDSFHLNQDLVKSGTTNPLINSGASKKKDGFKGLGFPHHLNLFDLDE